MAAIAEASATLSVTVFANPFGGFLRARDRKFLQALHDLADRLLLRGFADLIDNCPQFALQRTVIALRALAQDFDLLLRHILDREVDTHWWLHFGSKMD